MLPDADIDLLAPCQEQFDKLRRETYERLPEIIEVPSDDDLTQLDDASKLRRHLR